MTSTVDIGDSFRDAVAALLRTQYPDVATEQYIAGTKVDITFSDYHLGSTERCAVECKDYGDPLTKAYISEKIYPKYQPMLQSRLVSRVLIVSRHPLGSAAESYVDALIGYKHFTYEELAETLVGLRRYVEHLGAIAPESAADSYIEARFEEQERPAFAAIQEWLGQANASALAILGGYGQGKTSLAKRIAADAARSYLADPVNRMPILIRLGEVVHETQLEGLFGKEFTARHQARGYHFDTLMHLNELGRLLVILDGFDEMKHAMSALDFQANFREFNRLLTGKAKVMLLGRPNALPSNERELVFRGRKKIGNTTVQSPAFKVWTEWKLSFFSEEETSRLLHQQLAANVAQHERAGLFMYAANYVATRAREVIRFVPIELMRRPVHVVLIAEAAADPHFDFKGFNEYRLYSHFVRSMVERDTVGKPARREIQLESRLEFQRELAWWAWTRVGVTQGCFHRDEVPAALLASLPDGRSTDTDSKRNEYIVATLTEEKETGILFFAHRSFQEYLVAERMVVKSTAANHAEYSKFVTPEITLFVTQSDDAEYLDRWYSTLHLSRGPLSFAYLDIFTSSPSFLDRVWTSYHAADKESHSAATIAIIILALLSNKAPSGWWSVFEKDLYGEILSGDKATCALAVIALLALYGAGKPGITSTQMLAALVRRCLDVAESGRVGNPTGREVELIVPANRTDFAITWLGGKLHRSSAKDGTRLAFSPHLLFEDARHELTVETTYIEGAESDGHWDQLQDAMLRSLENPGSTASLDLQAVYKRLPEELVMRHKAFLYSAHSTFKVVPTERRGAVPVRKTLIVSPKGK